MPIDDERSRERKENMKQVVWHSFKGENNKKKLKVIKRRFVYQPVTDRALITRERNFTRFFVLDANQTIFSSFARKEKPFAPSTVRRQRLETFEDDLRLRDVALRECKCDDKRHELSRLFKAKQRAR